MDLTDLFLVSGLLAAWVGTVVGVMHAVGWIPPRYKTQLREIQENTATKIGVEVRAAVAEIKIPQLPEIPKLEVAALATEVSIGIRMELVPVLESTRAELVALRAFFENAKREGEARLETEVAAAKGQLGGLMKSEKSVAGEFAIAALQDSLGPVWMFLETTMPNVVRLVKKHPEYAAQILEWPIVKQRLQGAQAWLAEKGLGQVPEGYGVTQ
jgi:hypothetical protein